MKRYIGIQLNLWNSGAFRKRLRFSTVFFGLSAIQPVSSQRLVTPDFNLMRPVAMAALTSSPVPKNGVSQTEALWPIIQQQLQANAAHEKKQNAAFKQFAVKQAYAPPAKAEGEKAKVPGYRHFSKYDKGQEKTWLWGNNREGLGDEFRRVLRGNPRPALDQKGIRVALNARVPGFQFGHVNATSIVRVSKEELYSRDELQEARLVSNVKRHTLFVCSYVDGRNTVIQLENLKTREVLDTCVIEGYKGSPGITCLRYMGKLRVVGIFCHRLICLTIENKKFKALVFVPVDGVDCMDVNITSRHMVLCYLNGDVQTGEINGDRWQAHHRFQPEVSSKITSVEFKKESRIIFGLLDGRTLGYHFVKDSWLFYKEYFKQEESIHSIETCSDKGIVAVNGEDHSIVFVRPSGKIKRVAINKKKDVIIEEKKLIYMEFYRDGSLLYACKDGTVGKIESFSM